MDDALGSCFDLGAFRKVRYCLASSLGPSANTVNGLTFTCYFNPMEIGVFSTMDLHKKPIRYNCHLKKRTKITHYTRLSTHKTETITSPTRRYLSFRFYFTFTACGQLWLTHTVHAATFQTSGNINFATDCPHSHLIMICILMGKWDLHRLFSHQCNCLRKNQSDYTLSARIYDTRNFPCNPFGDVRMRNGFRILFAAKWQPSRSSWTQANRPRFVDIRQHINGRKKCHQNLPIINFDSLAIRYEMQTSESVVSSVWRCIESS